MKVYKKIQCECIVNGWEDHKINDKNCSGFTKGISMPEVVEVLEEFEKEINYIMFDIDDNNYTSQIIEDLNNFRVKFKQIIKNKFIIEE